MAGNWASIWRSRSTSEWTSSFWLVTEMYSPVPIENAPATSAATPDGSQVAEGGAQRGEVSAELFEAQVAAGPVEDVILREVAAELGVVLTGDRLFADADQAAGKRTVRDEAGSMTAEQADRQERRMRRTRQAIHTAALELFAERGYRETTINDIAERADVAPRTVTVHFPAKEELLFDAEPFTLDGLSKRLSERQPHESALEALRDWMATTMTEVETKRSELDGRFWERRALRAHIINTEPELRGRAPRQLLPFRARSRRRNRQRPRPGRKHLDPAPCGVVRCRRLA
jgi:AcrR family transcriptional regulator